MERVRIPQSGEIYRHFKNRLYQVIAVATHSETGEKLVIYQALYGDYQVYARPFAMFMSEVDHEKYPEVTQKYRFELVNREELAGAGSGCAEQENAQKHAQAAPSTIPDEVQETEAEELTDQIRVSQMEQSLSEEVNPKLMQFFDADTLEEKYNILVSMRDEVDDHLINSMAVVLDVVIPEGPVADRYEQLKACIRTKQRYETQRMR